MRTVPDAELSARPTTGHRRAVFAAVLVIAAASSGCSLGRPPISNPQGPAVAVNVIDEIPKRSPEREGGPIETDEEARANNPPPRVIMRPLSAMIPDPLRVGELIVLSVRPVLSHGPECLACTFRWHTDDSEIATFAPRDPPCERGTCAELRPVAPGEVDLAIEICPSFFASCYSETVHRRVVPNGFE